MLETVTIKASDIKTLTGGKLVGHDQTPNLVLSHTIEGTISLRTPVRKRQRGKFNAGCIVSVGDIVVPSRHVDEQLEVGTDWSAVKAEPLGIIE